jgi:hypothetical protein
MARYETWSDGMNHRCGKHGCVVGGIGGAVCGGCEEEIDAAGRQAEWEREDDELHPDDMPYDMPVANDWEDIDF